MKKQILITFAIFFILGFIISVALSYDKERRINMYLSDQLTMSNTQFDVTYKGYSTLSQSIYNSIISNKQIIKLMSDAGNTTSLVKQNEIRKELYDSLTSIYQDWGAMGIKQIHFHLKNNVSFLRMYAPSKFGDDLTSFRYSVKFVNQTQTPTDGLEMGKLGNGFRFVYPLIDSHSTHIGSVEISIPVEDFLQRIEDSFNAQVHFLVDKKYVDNIASISDIMDDVYSKTDISPQFYTLRSNKGDHVGSILPKTITKVMENKLLEKKPFYVYFKTNEGFYTIVTFLPIKNIEGNKVIAYIVKHSNGDYIYELQKDYYIVLLMVLSLLVGILFYAYKDYSYKQNLTKSFETIRRQKEELAHSVEELERQNVQIATSIEESRKKDNMIADQARLASLGEMIGNIAHQWRQPLSAISTSASSIIVQNELGILDTNSLNPTLDKIVEKTQFLSQTIEDFRNFIEGKKEKVEFVISSAIDNALSVIDSSILRHGIIIGKDYSEIIFITNYKNEFIQGVLNIINNAKDALDAKNDINNRLFFISVKRFQDKAVIVFQDNAGGIPEDILSKIFEPYFTTKHQSQGTGLGLYMTYKIITESMGGTLLADNHEFKYGGTTYFGARFMIELPLTLENKKHEKDEEINV